MMLIIIYRASLLEQNMKDLKADFKRIENLIKKWKRICSLGWFEANVKKLNFITKDLRELEDLNLKLEKHDKRIDRVLQTLQIGIGEGIFAALEEQRKKDAEESKKRAKESKKWEKFLDENGTDRLCQAARNPNTEVYKQLRNDLTGKGISKPDIEASISTIQKNLNKLKVEPTPPSAAPPAAPPTAVSLSPRKQQHIRILSVDGSNIGMVMAIRLRFKCCTDMGTVRSVMVQAYLELVRVWTANKRKQWLFKEVESAGCWVESKFTKKHQTQIKKNLQPRAKHSNDKALRTVYDQNQFQSREKDEIFERLKERKTRGILAVHFNEFDYILCFDKSTHDLLEKLKSCAEESAPGKPQRAKLVLLEGTELHDDWNETVEEVKIATQRWLEHEFKWTRPLPGLKKGAWRTQQMTIPDECFTILTAKNGAKRKEIESKSGCQLWLSSKSQDPKTLLSIVGPEEVLSKAETLVKALFLGQQVPNNPPKPKNPPKVTPHIVEITPKDSRE